MSIMLALATGGGGPPITKTYTFSQTVTIPAGVSNLVLVSGQGAPGSPADSYYQERYTSQTITYVADISNGYQTASSRGPIQTNYGPCPSSYCEPMQTVGTFASQVCYEFKDTSRWVNIAATTGAAATGFGKTFPGGAGGAATPQSFKDVAVTPGAQMPITVPAGGSITISYYA